MCRIVWPGKIQRNGKWLWLKAGIFLGVTCSVTMAGHDRHSRSTETREHFEGRQLFEKVWVPGTSSDAGGDGLGPLFNERSCVGCHNLGGTGGAGKNDKNVSILSVFAGPAREQSGKLFQGELEDLHPGFRNRSSVVLHHNATLPADEKRLAKMRECPTVQTRDELIALEISSRNTPALFGSGRIDSISDGVLLAAEKRQFSKFPEIKGRVSRLRDGRFGRFGWKGQTAGLTDFVLAACSNELGLEVAGHHQVSLTRTKDFDPSKLGRDLNDAECAQLNLFVRDLSPPLLRYARANVESPWGYNVFEAIGCATCHAPRLGSVNGIYSDLLLHDLGDRISNSGGYGSSNTIVDRARTKDKTPATGEAGPTEWRTPPLWGVADSAPYVHDGRASTLDEAIRLHGGEAAATSERYNKLSTADHNALILFLRSLTVSPVTRKPKAHVTKRPSKGGK